MRGEEAGLGPPAVRGAGRLGLMGGSREPVEIRADIAAAYDDDMFDWSRVCSSTAEDGTGESCNRNKCACFQK